MKLCKWAVDRLKDLWRWFFPAKINSRNCILPWLKQLFPEMNMNRVNMYAAMPGIVKALVPDNTNAIVLPSPVSIHKVNVYFRDEPQPCEIEAPKLGLALFAHEFVHVRQAFDHLGGIGLGFGRGYLVGYIYCYSEVGFNYDANPYEVEAYDFQEKVEDCLDAHSGIDMKPCDCSAVPPSRNESGLENWVEHCGDIQMTESKLGFWSSVWHCTPGLSRWREWTRRLWELCPRLARWLHDLAIEPLTTDRSHHRQEGIRDSIARLSYVAFRVLFLGGVSLLACAFIAIGTGIMFVLGIAWLIIALAITSSILLLLAALWAVAHLGIPAWAIATGILCLIDAIWWVLKKIWEGIKWLAGKIRDAAVWLWNRFKDLMANICTASENLSRNCRRWARSRREKCTDWKDETQEKCSDWKEETEEKCTDWGTETREECCDWQPCKFFCRTMVTVVEKVCVGFTTVTEKVCIAYTEVTSRVCVATTTIVERTCIGFSAAGAAVSCWARD